MTRTFNAPPARIFACFTSKEEWNGWAGSREAPGEITLLEPRVGGRYRMVMRRPDGVEMAVGGVFPGAGRTVTPGLHLEMGAWRRQPP